MSKTTLFTIKQSGMRAIPDTEIRKVFNTAQLQLSPHSELVDMQLYDIDGGRWDESEGYIIQKAREIRRFIDERETAEIAYFGLAEIPHCIALGAYLSDQYHVDVFGFDRDNDSWKWRKTDRTLNVEIKDWQKIHLDIKGEAVIRIEISSFILDKDLEEAVGTGHLADIRIQLSDDRTPMIGAGVVQSPADVQHIREVFRQALADLKKYRPNVSKIHLFVSAPMPVCFVLGQELQIRNNVPVQTYRYRQVSGHPSYKKAIELTGEEAESAARILTTEQVERADKIRTKIWPKVLKQVQRYSKMREREARGDKKSWYEYLTNHPELSVVKPFPQLPAIWEVVSQKDTVNPVPRPTEYGHPTDTDQWELSDALLIDLSDACEGSDEELERLIRLFLFHEYLHVHHSLSKYNVDGIGRFANCLERLDYMADLYALLHQLDYELLNNSEMDMGKEKDFIKDQLDLILRSTWAFVQGTTVNRPQVRAVRRLLNWYWRHVQVQQADSLTVALLALSQAPAIELIGPMISTGEGRVYMSMTDLDRTVELSLGIVLENEKFYRRENAQNYDFLKLLESFRTRDHEAVKRFFLGIFEDAKEKSGALPII